MGIERAWVDRKGRSIPFEIRPSRRARYVRLRIRAVGPLLVTVPAGFPHPDVPGVLERCADWITRAVDRLQEQAPALAAMAIEPPEEIALRAVGETWRVTYADAPAPIMFLRSRPDHSLYMRGPLEDRELVYSTLRKWLKHRGRATLVPWLGRVASETGMTYARSTIRCQRTRWGSCSAAGSINLNAQLLFVSPKLVRYLMVHELAHTRQPNHSPRFWTEVGRHDPEYQVHRKELGAAVGELPAWALLGH